MFFPLLERAAVTQKSLYISGMGLLIPTVVFTNQIATGFF